MSDYLKEDEARAFPLAYDLGGGDGFYVAPGMTLRDWFAGQALSAFAKKLDFTHDARVYAENAYFIADAMLAARAKHN